MMQGLLSRAALLLALCLVAAVIAVGGFVFLAMAFYFYLSSIMTPDLAALLTGLAILLLAAVLVILGKVQFRGPRRRRRGRAASDEELAGEAAAAAASLAAIAKRHSTELMIGAAAAGFVLGISRRARRALWALLR